MPEYQVTGVTKPNVDSPHEAITALCGAGWNWTRQEVVRQIKNQIARYYTQVDGKRAYLTVRVSANGTEYVQTIADGTFRNNLLSLKPCY